MCVYIYIFIVLVVAACTYPKSWFQFECFSTDKALIGTCTAVTPHVVKHGLFVMEHFITVGTSKQPTTVAPHVNPQCEITFQPLATLLALLLFTFCHMWIQVSFQCSLCWKYFGTYMTHEFTHSLMYMSLMSSYTSLAGKPVKKNLSKESKEHFSPLHFKSMKYT
jgi:hypothetical protein